MTKIRKIVNVGAIAINSSNMAGGTFLIFESFDPLKSEEYSKT
jgi:hypothetical protein